MIVIPLYVVVMWGGRVGEQSGRAGEQGWWSGNGEQDPPHHSHLLPQMDQDDSSIP